MVALSDRSPIVDSAGRPSRTLLRYFQELFNGTIKRTTFTAAQLLAMSPDPGWTAFCSDCNSETFRDPVASGGTFCVPVHADESSVWRVG